MFDIFIEISNIKNTFPVGVMTGVLLKYFACTKTPKTKCPINPVPVTRSSRWRRGFSVDVKAKLLEQNKNKSFDY